MNQFRTTFLRCCLRSLLLFVLTHHCFAGSEFMDGQYFTARFGHTKNPRFVSATAMVVDPVSGKLFVADWNGDRVLRYSSAQKMAYNGEPEAVFGQRSVGETLRQKEIVSTTLRGPAALAWDNGSLWVAEHRTRRVVRIADAANAPSGVAAAQVIGFENFVQGTDEYHSPYAPLTATTGWATSLAVDSAGTLWLCQGTRVIRFNGARFRGNMPVADGVLGQVDFTTEDYSGLAAPNKFYSRSIAAHGTTLWVWDETNYRILRFDNARGMPDNASASGVLGAPDTITKGGGLTDRLIGTSGYLSLDPAGNLLAADVDNYRVLRWRAQDTLTNGAAATSVFFQPDFTTRSPLGVVPYVIQADGTEHFFVADLATGRIRNVEHHATLPFVGTPLTANFLSEAYDNHVSEQHLEDPAGIAIDPATGKVFVSDRKHHRVLRFTTYQALREGMAAEWVIGQADLRSDVTGPASRSNLKLPRGLVCSPDGQLFVADTGHNRVLRFASAATRTDASPEADADFHFGQPDFFSEFASINNQGLDTPTGLALDSGNNLWVADRLNHRVVRFNHATAVAPDRTADLVVGQTSLNGFNFGSGANQFQEPIGVALDAAGHLWVADSGNHRVQRFDNAGSLPAANATASNVLGQRSTSDAADVTPAHYGIAFPEAVAAGPDGSIFVADSGYHRVLQYRAEDAAGAGFIFPHRVIGQQTMAQQRVGESHYSEGHLDTVLRSPQAVTVAPNGSLLVAEPWRHSVLVAAPLLVDSDNDGWLDAGEIYAGSDPASAASTPATGNPGSYGLNFTGRLPAGAISTDTDLPYGLYGGLVPQTGWRNASPDLVGGYSSVDHNEVVFCAQSRGATDLGLIQPGTPLPMDGDTRLMHGSMDSSPETRNVVDLYNIPWTAYDVYIYFDGAVANNRSDYTVTSLTKSQTLTGLRDLTDWPVAAGAGRFVPVLTSGAAGNVAIFKNFTGGRLRILGRAGAGGQSAPINAVQIVSHGRVRITSLTVTGQRNATTVGWDAMPGWLYTLQSSEDLQSWQNLVTHYPPLLLDPSHGSYTQQYPAAARRFYRVIME